MSSPLFRTSLVAALTLSLAGVAACGKEEVKYTPKPAYSGTKASLPPIPNLPQKPTKQGDVYNVWGAGFTLRSRVLSAELKGKEVKITGYIVKTNLPDAPACAVHKAGKADPPDCQAPVPTFWLGDTKDADLKECIMVKGWASNYAQIYDAIEYYDKNKKKDKVDPKSDTFWAVEIPNPLPVKGMKVTVTGKYGANFTKSSSGTEADPIMGIIEYAKMEVHEKVEEVAILPGMKLK